MDVNPKPFPGKAQMVRSKLKGPKTNEQELPMRRKNRAFGTVRNQTVADKIMTKSSTGIPKKPAKSSTGIPSKPSKSSQLTPTSALTAKNTPETQRSRAKPMKKSVIFSGENEEIATEPKTPVRSSPCLVKPKLSGGTPYQSAEKCSKCRLDRLETSSYWRAQIKLAESVGKHFVSVAFFQLALQSKAEPLCNLRVELKKYLERHLYLSSKKEWTEVASSYGILKNEKKDLNREAAEASFY